MIIYLQAEKLTFAEKAEKLGFLSQTNDWQGGSDLLIKPSETTAIRDNQISLLILD